VPPLGSVIANALFSNADSAAPGNAVVPAGDTMVRSYQPAGDAATVAAAVLSAPARVASDSRGCVVEARYEA
jgi:hypothetical protein